MRHPFVLLGMYSAEAALLEVSDISIAQDFFCSSRVAPEYNAPSTSLPRASHVTREDVNPKAAHSMSAMLYSAVSVASWDANCRVELPLGAAVVVAAALLLHDASSLKAFSWHDIFIGASTGLASTAICAVSLAASPVGIASSKVVFFLGAGPKPEPAWS